MDAELGIEKAAEYNEWQRENFQPLLVSAYEPQGQAAMSCFPLIF